MKTSLVSGSLFDPAVMAQVRERIISEHGHNVHVWSRIPAFKGSLIEVTLNFASDGFGVTSSRIVPSWVSWKTEHYDPERRNKERAQDATKHGRGIHAEVRDRVGMSLSANSRLDTDKVNGLVTLSKNLWDSLHAAGFRLFDAFAQWKMQSNEDYHLEARLRDEIRELKQGLGPGWIYTAEEKVSGRLTQIERQLDGELMNKDRRRLEDELASLDSSGPLKNKIRELENQIPARKGWFRVYFIHESAEAWKVSNLWDAFQSKLFARIPRAKWYREAIKNRQIRDLKHLFGQKWGKVVVWNNPATRTDAESTDITRWPKIAIQLMNTPKLNRELATLDLKDGYFQVE